MLANDRAACPQSWPLVGSKWLASPLKIVRSHPIQRVSRRKDRMNAVTTSFLDKWLYWSLEMALRTDRENRDEQSFAAGLLARGRRVL